MNCLFLFINYALFATMATRATTHADVRAQPILTAPQAPHQVPRPGGPCPQRGHPPSRHRAQESAPPVHVNLMPHSSPQGHFQPQFRLLQCQLPARTRLQGGPGLSHRAGGTEPPLPTPPAPPARAGAPGWKKRHFCTLGLAYLAPDQGFVEITCFLEEHWPWHHPPHACTRCSPHHRAFDILRGHVPISLSRVRVPPH